MPTACQGAHGAGTRYTYAELMGLWIHAGGPRVQAPVAAAIAMAESGGCSAAENPDGPPYASGVWQIRGVPFAGDVWDPSTNARMAVAKYRGRGDTFLAWQTYTDGSYRAFLSSKTTPDLNVGFTGGQFTGPRADAVDVADFEPAACLWSFPGVRIPVLGNVGQFCILSKPQARGMIGLALLNGGFLLLGLPGLALTLAGAGMKALGAAGPVLSQTGAAVALIPGAEAVGAGIAGAGQASARQRQQRRQRSSDQAAATERRQMRQLGEPRENDQLRTGRGAVRETGQGTRRRTRDRVSVSTADDDTPPF